MNKDCTQEKLSWRGLSLKDNICFDCQGSGIKTYGNTSTWRGVLGGQMLTSDVCDLCWGSGNLNKKGINIKEIIEKLEFYEEKVFVWFGTPGIPEEILNSVFVSVVDKQFFDNGNISAIKIAMNYSQLRKILDLLKTNIIKEEVKNGNINKKDFFDYLYHSDFNIIVRPVEYSYDKIWKEKYKEKNKLFTFSHI